MKESPLPVARSKPLRPPRKGSLYGSQGNNLGSSEMDLNGYGEMNGDGKDDLKKKRGRSPFRLVH